VLAGNDVAVAREDDAAAAAVLHLSVGVGCAAVEEIAVAAGGVVGVYADDGRGAELNDLRFGVSRVGKAAGSRGCQRVGRAFALLERGACRGLGSRRLVKLRLQRRNLISNVLAGIESAEKTAKQNRNKHADDQG
jgi:hypothetical protein